MKLSIIEIMKKIEIRRTVYVAALLLLVSCSREIMPLRLTADADGEKLLATEFHILPFEACGQNTKSALEECQDKISGINMLVFNAESGKLLEDHSGYFSSEALRNITLPSNGLFNIYFFANVPDLSGIFPKEEEKMETFGYRMNSYDEMIGTGFPMSYFQTVDTDAGGVVNIWFRRLVTRLELSFDKSALSRLHREGTFIKSMRLCNAALDVYPFAHGGSAATASTNSGEQADRAVDADVDILNAGGTVFLYTLTNMQGVLLPAETPQRGKTPQALESRIVEDKMKLLTYLEAHCRMDSEDWSGEDIVLRHYLGGESMEDYNCSFDIFPGKTRRISLVLNEDDPLLQPWRFESEGEILYKNFTLDKTEARIMKNFPSDITVSAPFDFEIISCGKHFRADIVESTLETASETWTKTIRVRTEEAAAALLTPGQKATPFTEQLVLGSLTRSGRDTSITVKTYREIFPLALRIGEDGKIRLFGDNPLGLSFRCDYEITGENGEPVINLTSAVCTPSLSGDTPAGYGNVIGSFRNEGRQAVVLNLLLQPIWRGNTGFFMGKGNAALFGPGRRFSPGKHDATKKIMYCQGEYSPPYTIDFYSNTDYNTSLSHITRTDELPQIFFLPSDDPNDTSLKTTDGFSFGKPDYKFKIGDFTPAGSTGHNNCDNHVMSDFETCPFYIANACMQGTDLRLFTHHWNFENMTEEITVNFLSPGRDLFAPGAAAGNTADARLVFRIKGLYVPFDVMTAIDEASYSYSGVHLVVNGCTCWPGGSPSRDGIGGVKL